MVFTISGVPRNCSGVVCSYHSKSLVGLRTCNERMRFNDYTPTFLVSQRVPRLKIQHFPAKRYSNKHIFSVGRDNYPYSYEDDLLQEPFWLSLIKETIWAFKSLFVFLGEQPSQLKYIEWPSFQSTLKTSTLTLVLVALLIVALSSVDSILCYLLALFLRKTP